MKIPSTHLNRRYLFAILTIVLLRALDLFITYRYTPNLSFEANPVVSVFGASWKGLIIFQAFLVAFIVFLMHFYFARKTPLIEQKELPFHDFIYIYFFNKLKPWPKRMFTFPKNIKRHLALNGFLLMVLAIAISIFAIVHNLLLLAKVESYSLFVIEHYKVYFPAVFLGATIGAFYVFCSMEYARYKKGM
jgi:hypothetical protein